MPELPEVETVRRYLANRLIGQKISQVEVNSAKQFQGKTSDIIGAQIVRLDRRAKILIIETDRKAILIHLKMTGQIIYFSSQEKPISLGHPLPFDPGQLPNQATRLIVTLDSGDKIFFNDSRKFGWWRLVDKDKIKQSLPILGPEPLTDDFSLDYFVSSLAKTRRAIKIALLDQHLVAGIGNIYACESLYQAGIDPRRPSNQLSLAEINKLYLSIRQILSVAINLGGTSAADKSYIRPDVSLGGYQSRLQVYQREKENCFGCRGKVKRIKQAGRSTFFCPNCQH